MTTAGIWLVSLVESWRSTRWWNETRETYTYDSRGNNLSRLSEIMANGWRNNQMVFYTYDDKNNILTRIVENWLYAGLGTGQWILTGRYTYTYDQSGNQLTELSEYYSNDHWVNSQRITSIYDNAGNKLSMLRESWTGSTWGNDFRYTYQFDNSGNQIFLLIETWDAYSVNWKYVNRCTDMYDNNNNWLTSVLETWGDSTWFNSDITHYSYDKNGNTIQCECNVQDNTWGTGRDYVIAFYNNKTDREYIEGHFVTVQYTSLTRIQSTNIKFSLFSLSQNYPNPFNPSTKIRFTLPFESVVKLQVYNTLGQLVAEPDNSIRKAGEHEVSFDAARYSSVVFFYSINAKSVDGKHEYHSVKKMLFLK